MCGAAVLSMSGHLISSVTNLHAGRNVKRQTDRLHKELNYHHGTCLKGDEVSDVIMVEIGKGTFMRSDWWRRISDRERNKIMQGADNMKYMV